MQLPCEAPFLPARLMAEKESAMAYAAFKLYFELGDTRAIREVQKRLNKSAKVVYSWAKRFHWDERVDHANGEVQAIYRRLLETKMASAVNQIVDRRIEIALANMDIIELAQAKAKEVLTYLVVKETHVTHNGQNITFKPSPNIRLTDAIRLLIGANVAAQQAEAAVSPRRAPGPPGKASTRPDGTPTSPVASDQPGIVFFLDGGDGVARPLSELPPPDRVDPYFNPYDGTSTPPVADETGQT